MPKMEGSICENIKLEIFKTKILNQSRPISGFDSKITHFFGMPSQLWIENNQQFGEARFLSSRRRSPWSDPSYSMSSAKSRNLWTWRKGSWSRTGSGLVKNYTTRDLNVCKGFRLTPGSHTFDDIKGAKRRSYFKILCYLFLFFSSEATIHMCILHGTWQKMLRPSGMQGKDVGGLHPKTT